MKSPHLFSFILIVLVLANVFDACESQNRSSPLKTITVSQSGKANFETIQSAIDSVSPGNSQWIHLQISPGVYREQVLIPEDKPCIYLEGAGSNSTSIQWGSHINATFESNANNTAAKGITFVNTLNDPVLVKVKSNITQANAARIHADKCAFFDCAFYGVQDTLYDDYGRHYYLNCYIQGAIDFIYGDGQSIFEACTINVSTGRYGPNIGGVITAQERNSPNDPSGFVFKNCNIMGTGKAELGRALDAYARVVIANSYLSNVVSPQGWSPRNFTYHVANLTFVEEGCRGPGANKKRRVKWMKHLWGRALEHFVNISYIDKEGWIAKLPANIFT